MATEILNFPKQLYVGVKEQRPFNVETFPLAFATPFGTDAAFKKRKETVNVWVGNPQLRRNVRENGEWKTVPIVLDYEPTEPTVIDNNPIEGFKFEGAVSRWTTSNKWFEINDPRGFTLQVTADNLGDILLNCEVRKGEIIGKFVWGRLGAVNFLTRVDHPSYIEFTQPEITRTELQPGDRVRIGNEKEEVIFVGIYYAYQFQSTHRYQHAGKLYDKYPYGAGGYYNKSPVETVYFAEDKFDSTPIYLFIREQVEEIWYRPKFVPMRKPKKALQILEENQAFTKPNIGEITRIAGASSFFEYARFYDSKVALNAAPRMTPTEINAISIKESQERHGDDYFKKYDYIEAYQDAYLPILEKEVD